MRTAAFIPIKTNSTRLTMKNFKLLGGRPLYTHIIDHALQADCFSEVFVDTDSHEIAMYAEDSGAVVIDRNPDLASDSANGNDLIVAHAQAYPEFDYIFQLFATSPFLSAVTINQCVRCLVANDDDSIFTVLQKAGWFWFQDQPVNYRPNILPRSQDAKQIMQETCGLYGIRRDAALKYRSRIGATPFMWQVSEHEAHDIDTLFDFEMAERMLEVACAS